MDTKLNKGLKITYVILIGISMFVGILALSYAYYTFSITNNANITATFNSPKNSFYLTVTNEANITYTIDQIQEYGSDYDSTIEIPYNRALSCTLNKPSSVSDNTFTCTYDIVWIWNSSSSAYVNTNNDFYFYSNTYSSMGNVYLPSKSSGDEFVIKKVTTRYSGNCSYDIRMVYKNYANVDQSSLVGMTIMGYITYKNLSCTQD